MFHCFYFNCLFPTTKDQLLSVKEKNIIHKYPNNLIKTKCENKVLLRVYFLFQSALKVYIKSYVDVPS